MLALARNEGQSIIIDGRIEVKVVKWSRSSVRLAIQAPREVAVDRDEIWRKMHPGRITPLEAAEKERAGKHEAPPARIRMRCQLDRVVLFVKNVRETAAFYAGVLGLTPLGEAGDEWMELDAGGIVLALHKLETSYQEAKILPSTKLQFIVPDVAAAKAALQAQGISMGEVIAGPQTRCEGTDPSGNIFVFVDH